MATPCCTATTPGASSLANVAISEKERLRASDVRCISFSGTGINPNGEVDPNIIKHLIDCGMRVPFQVSVTSGNIVGVVMFDCPERVQEIEIFSPNGQSGCEAIDEAQAIEWGFILPDNTSAAPTPIISDKADVRRKILGFTFTFINPSQSAPLSVSLSRIDVRTYGQKEVQPIDDVFPTTQIETEDTYLPATDVVWDTRKLKTKSLRIEAVSLNNGGHPALVKVDGDLGDDAFDWPLQAEIALNTGDVLTLRISDAVAKIRVRSKSKVEAENEGIEVKGYALGD